MLNYMYITKSPETARMAENAGVNRVFVDLEKRGKAERQFGLNTVQSDHTVEDVSAVRHALHQAELLVRVNPIYEGSEEEIRSVLDAGADILMLPYFKTVEEVQKFLSYCGGRAQTMLLVETPEAAEHLEEILSGGGVDFIHVGINDLHLALKRKFMFELLADGTVEKICRAAQKAQIPYGFGGVARLGKGLLPAEYVLAEHYRLKSSAVILSRSFCDTAVYQNPLEIEEIFQEGVSSLRQYERFLQSRPPEFFEETHQKMAEKILSITEAME